MRRAIVALLLAAGVLAPPAAAQLPIGGTPPPEEEQEQPRREPPPVTPAPDPGTDWIVEGADATHRFWTADSGVAPPSRCGGPRRWPRALPRSCWSPAGW